MARVTVEDCIERVSNRFDLVMLAAQRAREISAGALLTIERDNDKNPVIALREIADETVTPDTLEHSLVQGLQKRADFDEFEDEEDFGAIEGEMQLQPGGVVAAVPEPEAESIPDSEAKSILEAAAESIPESEAESIEDAEGEAASDPGETDDSLGAEEDK